ncbi:hypothetical protein [Bifidobacterium sp. ESL0745]|uniref:hypothetical protein n=1 Tax=Bifidobacterium sp. ESL0745 TaxID=2983226 RepID=UPI0023F6FEBA|nr:hypothetical protein [Bifidobacterium sp. ESL0745]MDF7665734.1 hypothetical protein [Bifidobacterium sp. ESL0745]
MRCARSIGISYKRFLGWEPTPGDDVEWDETEREWMLALQEYEASFKCPRCGMPIEFCHDQDKVEAVFSGAGVETCFVSEMQEKALRKFSESGIVEAPDSQTTKLKPRIRKLKM